MQVYGGNYTRILDHPEEMRELLSNAYKCNLVIENGGSAAPLRKLGFWRAWYYYNVVDLFGAPTERLVLL
jgi:hypothetical protein